jgi:peroxiredoxin
MVSEGDHAPDFELLGTDGEEITEYKLTDHLEDGPVVLAFYPQDFSPVCTEELCTLHEGDFFAFAPGVDIFGISNDGIYSHREFIDKHGLGFPLLSDSETAVADAYGARYDEPVVEMGNSMTKRSLFMIDEEQTVRYAWITDDVREQPDLLEAKNRLDEVVA